MRHTKIEKPSPKKRTISIREQRIQTKTTKTINNGCASDVHIGHIWEAVRKEGTQFYDDGDKKK